MTAKKSHKQQLLRVIVGSLLVSAFVLLIQLWFGAFSEELLVKLLGTLALVIVVAAVLVAIVSDIQEDQTHKKDKYLN